MALQFVDGYFKALCYNLGILMDGLWIATPAAGGLHEQRYLEGGSKVLIFIFPNEKDEFILEGVYVLDSLYRLSLSLIS